MFDIETLMQLGVFNQLIPIWQVFFFIAGLLPFLLMDRVKICAYNAEEWMLDRLIHHYGNAHDVRALLRSFAELSGQMETSFVYDEAGIAIPTGITVSLDPPDTPKHREALRGLVNDLNVAKATYPGTAIRVTYRVRVHHCELAA